MESPISRFKIPLTFQADSKDRAVIFLLAFFMFCQLEVGLLNDTLGGQLYARLAYRRRLHANESGIE